PHERHQLLLVESEAGQPRSEGAVFERQPLLPASDGFARLRRLSTGKWPGRGAAHEIDARFERHRARKTAQTLRLVHLHRAPRACPETYCMPTSSLPRRTLASTRSIGVRQET